MPRQARILLVDDRVENLIALDAILSPLNQILVPVRSGEQALQALRAEEFALVLLDILMPGMSGFETAARIKREARTRDVPIIFLTAAGPSRNRSSSGTTPEVSTTWPNRSTRGCSRPRWRSSWTCT